MRKVVYIIIPIMILAFLVGFPAYIALGQEDSNQDVTITVSAKPLYISPPTGGGGGGGGSTWCPAGQVSTAGKITTKGLVMRDFVVVSFDKRFSLILHEGTIALDRQGVCFACIGINGLLKPPLPPNGAHVIGFMYDVVPDKATFTPPATVKYNYDPNDILEGVAEESLVIACYDWESNKWNKLDSVVDTEVNIITAKISQFNDLAVLGYKAEAPVPAIFECISLSISPIEVSSGETVNITALVTNTGGQSGTYSVILKINGMSVSEKNIVLNAGVSEQVSFSISKDAAGTYSVDVNGLTGSFVVKEKTVTPPIEPTPVKPAWWLIGGIIAAVVIASVIFMVRRMVR